MKKESSYIQEQRLVYLNENIPSLLDGGLGGGGRKPPEDREDIQGKYEKMMRSTRYIQTTKKTLTHPDDIALCSKYEKSVQDDEERFREIIKPKIAEHYQSIDTLGESTKESQTALNELAEEIRNMMDVSMEDIVEGYENLTADQKKDIFGDVSPGVGTIKGLVEIVQGETVFAGANLTFLDKLFTFMGVLPGAGILKGIRKFLQFIAKLKKKKRKHSSVDSKDKTPVYEISRNTPLKDVEYMLKEQSDMIRDMDLKEFLPKTYDIMEARILEKRGNDFLESRLLNLNNFVKYVVDLKENTNRVASAEKLREAIKKDLFIVESKIQQTGFQFKTNNRELLDYLLEELH